MDEYDDTPERLATVEALLGAHVRDCGFYRASTESKLNSIASDVKVLIIASERAKGRADASNVLLGGIPNAFWSGVMLVVGSIATAAAVHYWPTILR